MAVQLVRPTSLPYEATGALLTRYLELRPNIAATTTPTFSGDGSMSDDADATGVTMTATQNTAGTADCTVLAADFGPIMTSSVNPSGLGTMFRYGRAMTAGTGTSEGQYLEANWDLLDHAGTERAGGDPTDFLPVRPTSHFNDIATDPTTYESGPTDYAWIGDTSGLSTMFAEGFTLIWSVEVTTTTPGTIVTPFYFAEVGLYLDYSTGGSPPLRRYPRSDGLGVGARRHYPPPATAQGSTRRMPSNY